MGDDIVATCLESSSHKKTVISQLFTAVEKRKIAFARSTPRGVYCAANDPETLNDPGGNGGMTWSFNVWKL